MSEEIRNSDDVPKSMWAPRTDAGARKLVGEVHRLRTELKQYVTYKGVAVATVVIVSAAWVVTELGARRSEDASKQSAAQAKESVAKVESHLEAHEQDHKQEMQGLRSDLHDDLQRIEIKVDKALERDRGRR